MRLVKLRNRMLGTAAGLFVGLSVHLLLLDGLDGLLLSMLFTPSTQFAPGYSSLAYWRVHPGMSQVEVVKLLGEPLDKFESPTQGSLWRYSRSPTDSHYHQRTVRVSNEGIVTKVHHEYYVD
ncbi:hypothetical protein [Myxococcus sp. Y35]|uniref:hypothetical protein n=1 Tax=Pseudomyxococcus flavus TaxID=3115648 RepID=UPI003CFA33EC